MKLLTKTRLAAAFCFIVPAFFANSATSNEVLKHHFPGIGDIEMHVKKEKDGTVNKTVKFMHDPSDLGPHYSCSVTCYYPDGTSESWTKSCGRVEPSSCDFV
jgi:hypothetical protein